MKKTLIAVALAALPVASMADVVLYGQIKGGVQVSKVRGTPSTLGAPKSITTAVVDYGSRIGFKGHEDLGNGVQAIWQLEQRVDVAGGGKAGNAGLYQSTRGFGTRDSFVGLKTPAGTVKAGYFAIGAGAVNDALDIWEYSDDVLDYGNAAGLATFTRGNAATDRRVNVTYETPEVAGFSGSVSVATSDNEHVSRRIGSMNKKDSAAYGLTASYKNAGFFADLGATVVRDTADAEAAGKKYGYQAVVQGGYDANGLLVGLAYQTFKAVDDEAAYKGNEVALSAAYEVVQGLKVKGSAAYGFGFKDADGEKVFAGDNGKYYQGILGADYALSKRTVVNAQVGQVTYGKGQHKARVTTGTVGLKHAF